MSLYLTPKSKASEVIPFCDFAKLLIYTDITAEDTLDDVGKKVNKELKIKDIPHDKLITLKRSQQIVQNIKRIMSSNQTERLHDLGYPGARNLYLQ